jgi:hypothetical protein
MAEGAGQLEIRDLEAGRFEEVRDKSVYWTASFYVAAQRIPRSVLAVLRASDELRRIRNRDKPSKTLSDAMEPLFNDISDRERAGKIDDFLFATAKDENQTETWIEIAQPPVMSWTTEGLTTTASPPDPLKPQQVRVRRFWYVHRDGSVTWHVSFWMPYGPMGEQAEKAEELRRLTGDEDFWHSPALLYFLSGLQKVLAPKEFAGKEPVKDGVKVHMPPPGGLGVAPLDGTTIRLLDGKDPAEPFWVRMGKWFDADADYLFDRVDNGWRGKLEKADKARAGEIESDPFSALVSSEPFLEVPGLMMPRFRYMFFFVDETFFNRLMPPVEDGGRQLEQRTWYVHENCYRDYLKKNDELTVPVSKDEKRLALDEAYWDWVLQRPDIARKLSDLRASVGEEEAEKILTNYKRDKRAYKDDRRPDCLNYLFLSGFNQNIIDFMAQDASEVLDSLDPVYPEADDDSGERFFVRYATPRGFLTYVRASRSLEAGNDHIGTCPYAFLIHVLALHNEYLARDYEISTELMIKEIGQLNETEQASKAVERFYRFRTGEFSDFARNIYGNVFRYDTEGKVFAEVERRRGIKRKTEYLDVIVENLEKQTSDLQGRLARREDRVVNFALAGVGIFGAFGLALQLLSMYQPGAIKAHGELLDVGLWLSIFVGGGALGLVIFMVTQNIVEEAHNRRRRRDERAKRDAEYPAKTKP